MVALDESSWLDDAVDAKLKEPNENDVEVSEASSDEVVAGVKRKEVVSELAGLKAAEENSAEETDDGAALANESDGDGLADGEGDGEVAAGLEDAAVFKGTFCRYRSRASMSSPAAILDKSSSSTVADGFGESIA